MPNVLRTFSDLQGFLQLYNEELEIDHKTNPDLPLSQPKAKQNDTLAKKKVAKSREMTTLNVGRPTGKEGKMATKEV